MHSQYTKVDYLFAGADASTTLLIMCMEKQGLLKDKKIFILDQDAKYYNDKTYFFWSEKNEKIDTLIYIITIVITVVVNL